MQVLKKRLKMKAISIAANYWWIFIDGFSIIILLQRLWTPHSLEDIPLSWHHVLACSSIPFTIFSLSYLSQMLRVSWELIHFHNSFRNSTWFLRLIPILTSSNTCYFFLATWSLKAAFFISPFFFQTKFQRSVIIFWTIRDFKKQF